jgi:methylphosphotriester-DNA--protein-cysteine methyltransferase
MMSLIRCPLCKAENAEGPACRRCKADLSLLFRLEEQRAWTMAAVRRLLATGRTAEAFSQVLMAKWMRSDAESERLFALARLLKRDFAGAWSCYRTLGNLPSV